MSFQKWVWVFVGIFILRLLSVENHTKWIYADEWFQTAEFANLIVSGTMSFVQEVPLHLRNLFWPGLLSLPVGVANWLSPDSVYLKSDLVRIFSGLLDLGVLWGWIVLTRRFIDENRLKATFLIFSLGFLFLPWFTVTGSTSPSSEHAATVFLWLALGTLAKRKFAWSGLFLVSVGLAKYPAGLFGVGFLIAAILRVRHSEMKKEDLQKVLVGALGGIAIGGVLDWGAYGRPYESLWMFLQYNVFTGAGARIFGAQDASAYASYFFKHWTGPLFPLASVLLPAVFLGWIRGLKRRDFAAYGALVYLLGHLWVAHKEERFMEPIEWILLWYGLTEWGLWWTHLKSSAIKGYLIDRFGTKGLKWIVVVIMVCNGGLFLRECWGERWSAQQTYFEADSHLRAQKKIIPSSNVCALVSVRRPISINLPRLKMMSVGFLPLNRRGEKLEDQVAGRGTKPLVWVDQAPHCQGNDFVFLHLHRPEGIVSDWGCTILPSGVLSWIPESSWNSWIARKWVSGTWYRCEHSVLEKFSRQEVRKLLVHQIKRLDILPGKKTQADDLIEMISKVFPGYHDGVMPDL